MPPTAETEALLKTFAEAEGPTLQEMTPEEARAAYLEMRALQGEPEDVAVVEGRTVPGPAGDIPVRVYRPEGAGAFPALVYYHGGGWIIGDLDTHDPLCRHFANAAGCVVVVPDYRLAPEHKYPAAADDCYAATKWVAEHGAEIGVDRSRIAVGGDSSGGNLAAVVALMARDRGGPTLAAQVLIYPVTDHRFDTASYRDNGKGYLLETDLMQLFWDSYLSGDDDGAQPYASPLRAPDVSGVAPAHIITAEFDVLRDEGEAYGKRLQEAGVATRIQRYDGMIHGFVQFGAAIPQAHDAIADVVAGLKAALSH